MLLLSILQMKEVLVMRIQVSWGVLRHTIQLCGNLIPTVVDGFMLKFGVVNRSGKGVVGFVLVFVSLETV
jgi:hypothetical protein